MTRELVPSRSGAQTLRLNGVYLHSRYDPRREADRHREKLTLSPGKTRVVVVIGEGLPYLSNAIATNYPELTVLAALLGPVSADYLGPQLDLTMLSTGGLSRWMRSVLPPLDLATLELVTWEAGRRAAPGIVAAAQQEVLDAVRTASAEIATIGSFGRRWLTNSVRSAVLIDDRREITVPEGDVTLATSGPSLERLLTAGRAAFPGLLATTSSAWAALRSYGISPEIVVHTDGGYWAARYLTPHAPSPYGTPATVAITASAAVPYALLQSSYGQFFGFLATGSLADQLHADHEAWQPVPEAPTVTATALYMVHRTSPQSNLYLAGVDLVSRGLVSHARPHPNDRLIAAWAHRLRPELSIRAERTFRPSPYAHRLADGVVGYRSPALHAFLPEINRILALHQASGAVASLIAGGADRSRSLSPSESRARIGRMTPRPPRSERIAHIHRVLRGWREMAESGSWSTDQREILFHLAPIEVLQALRGEEDQKAAVAAAHTGIEVIQRVVQRISRG